MIFRQPVAGAVAALLVGCVVAGTAVPALGQDRGAASESLGEHWLHERMVRRTSPRRDSPSMRRLVAPVARNQRGSVVGVMCGDRSVALGTVVDAHSDETVSAANAGSGGLTSQQPEADRSHANVHFVVTKRSELTNSEPIRVRLADGRLLPSRVAAVRREHDLALLAVRTDSAEASGSLRAVRFAAALPPVGHFLITPDRDGHVRGLGVVGAGAMKVAHRGRLGVALQPSAGNGARVGRVLPGSGADRAGVEMGDRIVAINGQSQDDRSMVMATLRDLFPGDLVQLTIDRSGDTVDVEARLRDASMLEETENDARVNGPRNLRLSGFDRVIQHDTVLSPQHCGGPVVDLQGRVVGINIARAGRVVSYSLPAATIAEDIDAMIREARTQ